MIIGIDLGTTYSLAAVMQADQPVLIPNKLGEYLTPSAVSVTGDGTILVGAAARARAVTHPLQSALAFKRDMGTLRRFSLGKEVFTPQGLSALVLRSLKEDAEGMLGEEVREAVITVPAYFGDLQRSATKEAASIAGLRVDRIINEPTAAALAYGLKARDRDLTALVLDLGGGTFDVTLLQISEGVIEIQSCAGDARLGGEDFDDALTAWALAHIKRQLDEVEKARLRAACEEAKRRLTQHEATQIVLPDVIDVRITRADAESNWQPLIERMRTPIQRALADGRKLAADVDEVLLVGGATRMPCVRALAARMFGRLPVQHLPPDEAVAQGAAVQAALKINHASVQDLVVTDVAPFSLGIETASSYREHVITGLFTALIDRGTVIPCSRTERFSPIHPHQSHIEVKIYQGEHSECTDNTLLGSYSLRLNPKHADKSVDVRLTYDLNGILEVEMTPIETGVPESFVIQERLGSMTTAAINAARERMKSLKISPRDKLPNAYALARAEAFFLELTGEARLSLGSTIAEFKAVLAGQDDHEIARARELLLAIVNDLRK